MKCSLIIWGHSESTFVEEGRGHWKANKNEQEEGEGPSMSVRSLFLKKCWDFKTMFIGILQFFLLIITQYEILNKPS